MAWRIGTGPVFIYESIRATRRWQLYAFRAMFVSTMLIGLLSAAEESQRQPILYSWQLAEIGQRFFTMLALSQLALVMLAAPATTAGSICLDRARGSLTHLLVTDLTAAEIVLGKFAAQLAPTVALLLASLPVLFLSTLLGGIDNQSLLRLFLVSLAVGSLGCSLALMISNWAKKSHEVLFTVYAMWAIWIFSQIFIDEGVHRMGWPSFLLEFEQWNPFHRTFSSYGRILSLDIWDDLSYLAFFLALSSVFLLITMWRIRRISGKSEAAKERTRRRRRIWDLLPGGPTLETNPLLWRELNATRPTRWSIVVTRLLLFVYLALVAQTIVTQIQDYWRSGGAMNGEFGLLVHGFSIAVALLFVTVNAATSLAEERVRGSLDVVMTTPISTRTIVMSKWWGVFLPASLIAIVPTFGVFTSLLVHQGDWLTLLLMPALVLSYIAACTSLGLLMATVNSGLGKAIGWAVTIYCMITVGGYVLPFMVFSRQGSDAIGFSCMSPFTGVAITVMGASAKVGTNDAKYWIEWGARYWLVFWCFVTLMTNFALLWFTLRIFDQALGRNTSGGVFESGSFDVDPSLPFGSDEIDHVDATRESLLL